MTEVKILSTKDDDNDNNNVDEDDNSYPYFRHSEQKHT